MTDYAVTLCSECHIVPIITQPKVGTAKMWEKILICLDCAQKWIEKQARESLAGSPDAE